MTVNVPPLRSHRRPVPASAGFSLVEICLALGIVAFALVPLVGLLAVGLDSYHNANLRGVASQVVEKIASAVRRGSATSGYDYVAAAPFGSGASAIKWTVVTPSAGVTATPASQVIYFDENGDVTSAPPYGAGTKPAQMVAMVVLTPPTTQFDAGEVQIAVAWPAVRPPTYSTATGITFSNPQGHDESTISFLPNSP
ncbi:MAG: hypothetical protein INR62_01595 [Rhodospirillales bacterium]|nr:hypothetical protein [Acetobacter sp.]